MAFLKLVRAEFVRTFLLTFRYPLEFVSGLLLMYLFFFGLFIGARTLVAGGTIISFSLSSFIVSYLMWFFVISALNRYSYSIEVEAQQGILEQIYLNFPRYLFLQYIRAIVDFILGVVFVSLLLTMISFTTGHFLTLDFEASWQAILVVVVSIIGINGFGLIFGGLALMFKRIGQVGSLMQFVFFLLSYLPTEQFSRNVQFGLYFLPLTQGVKLLKLIVIQGENIFSQTNLSLFGGLILNSAAYFCIGSLFFLLCERKAKIDGRLSQY